jgi:hypothetical protein
MKQKTKPRKMKKLIIDSKYKKDITRIKDFMHANDAVIDFMIGTLNERMELKEDREREMLWDHIMNDFDYNIEYTNENTN